MAYLLKSGTTKTVGSSAGKTSRPLPLHLSQPKRLRRPWDSTSRPSTSNVDGMEPARYLNSTAPRGCRVTRLGAMEWHFEGHWQPVQVYNTLRGHYRQHPEPRMNDDHIRDAALGIGAYLNNHGDCVWRIRVPRAAARRARF